METVYDYVKYYKNSSFKEIPFNDMDNIVFSTLSYLPLENIVFKEEIKLSEIFPKLKINQDKSIIDSALKLLKEIYNTARYKDIRISNYINIVNEKTQFAALTIRFIKGNCYVAYRGTDTSIIGWKENFELAYKYPVPAQHYATIYLKETIKITDKTIYVGGHSKGGNLAMASVMEINANIFKKIKTVFNNDGPGFLTAEFNSKKYRKMQTKLKTFIPEESIVGILLENENNIIIKSNATGIKAHDLTTWNCFGTFLKQGHLSIFSKQLKEKLNIFLQNSDNKKKKTIVEDIFKIIKMTNTSDLKELKITTIKQAINKVKEIDIDTKKYY